MQDCKDQNRGDIVSPWKKFSSVKYSYYNTAEINLSVIQFIELEIIIHSFKQISKTERRADWTQPSHSDMFQFVK